MKLTIEHQNTLKEMIDHVVTEVGDLSVIIEKCKSKPGDWAKRVRWNLLYTVEFSLRKGWFDAVYQYANDDHIDTALRSVTKQYITPMKMYIAILDEFPDYMVPTLVAHSVLSAHMHFIKIREDITDIVDFGPYQYPDYIEWLTTSFKKVTVRVNQKEFDKISKLPNIHIGHENNTLEGRDSCIVVCPFPNKESTPNVLRFAKTWAPKLTSEGKNEHKKSSDKDN